MLDIFYRGLHIPWLPEYGFKGYSSNREPSQSTYRPAFNKKCAEEVMPMTVEVHEPALLSSHTEE